MMEPRKKTPKNLKLPLPQPIKTKTPRVKKTNIISLIDEEISKTYLLYINENYLGWFDPPPFFHSDCVYGINTFDVEGVLNISRRDFVMLQHRKIFPLININEFLCQMLTKEFPIKFVTPTHRIKGNFFARELMGSMDECTLIYKCDIKLCSSGQIEVKERYDI